MDTRVFLFALIGLGLMASIFVERRLERGPISLAMVYVAIGYAVFALPFGLPSLAPVVEPMQAGAAEYLTEFIVIVSLLGAGLAIDRKLSWRAWRQIWPLLVILMPLSIATVAWLGWAWLGLAPAAAILLAASLSPTDPVLARSVAVGPPGDNERHDIRFSLTAEAGLNDGLAFPFTYLAIAAIGVTGIGDWTWDWFKLDFLWRIIAGVGVGYLFGRVGSWYVFEKLHDMEQDRQRASEGVIVLGSLLGAYGLAELVNGYGFLAVFVGAVAARQREHDSAYHATAHHFIEQVERIVLVAMLLGFGGLLASGIMAPLGWDGALLGVLILFVIRPVFGVISQVGCGLPLSGRFAVAFFGIRGMGTLYYLAYGMNHGEFADMDRLWAIACFTILASIVLHGVTSGPLLEWVEKRGGHVLPDPDPTGGVRHD